MLICIDAGHGKYTAGKRCMKTIDPNETREWVLNSRIADKLQTMLAGYDCTTMRVDDVTGETDVSLDSRCSQANKAKADVYVSIHHNAGINGGSGGGIVVYIHPNHQAQSEVVQEAAYRHLIAQTGLKGNRANPIAEANHQVTRETTMPAILCECGFMDSTVDTPIILTEEFSRQCAQGLCDALAEVYALQPVNAPREQTTYTMRDGVHDFAVPVSAFALELIDEEKEDCGENYVNAGYFGKYGADPEYTLPAGHLVANFTAADSRTRKSVEERGSIVDGKMRFDSFGFDYFNPFYQKAVSVLLVKDGAAAIQEVQGLPECDYAVAGIPVLRNGKKVTSAQALAQGWDKSSLRATYHIFVGLKGDGRIHVLGMKTSASNLLDSGEVADTLQPYGYTDILKLDGGGSYIIKTNLVSAATSENRRICSIIRMGPVVKAEPEQPQEPGEPDLEEDAGYSRWKSYMERYRKELSGAAATMPELVEEAVAMGLTDGSRPRDLMTREEGMIMARAAAKADTK